MEANPVKFPQANHAGARALSNFLLSTKIQNFLQDFGRKADGNHPLFYPVNRT
jgi:tungstate transport system substrate-binding protein